MPRDHRPDRIHLLSAANPIGPDLARFGFSDLDHYLAFIASNLAAGLRLTFSREVLRAVENPRRGGRDDDALRIRDLQEALDDSRTLAIVASNGGAWFSRILPHIDFSALARRRTPLTVFGFSELTGLVNAVASYRGGRGVYWLCPNYLCWKVRPASTARRAFGAWWRRLPEFLGRAPRLDGADGAFPFNTTLHGTLLSGRLTSGPIRVVGGCISVLVALLTGPLARRIRPDGRWLAIEDVREATYRVDRHLSSLKHAGWFTKLAGVLIGDFHTDDEADQARSVVELMQHHVPAGRDLPVVVTGSFGHVWPMAPLPINETLKLTIKARQVTIEGALARNAPRGRL